MRLMKAAKAGGRAEFGLPAAMRVGSSAQGGGRLSTGTGVSRE